MILLLHNRYRVPGGEEQAVADLQWLIREELGEGVEVLERDSAALSSAGAASGLLRGGLRSEEVADAVRRTGARVVHAHNVNPSLGWRSLAAAKEAGARVVLHLHNYRLVCAVGTCFTLGSDCVRCHGRDTWPGVRLNCRGGSVAEAAAYGAGLALWQTRLCDQADAFVVPSAFALRRLHELGAPIGDRAVVLPSVQRSFAERSIAAAGRYVLYVGRLSAEKGVADAIEACRRAGLPLVVAGDGPAAADLHALAGDGPHRGGPGDVDAARQDSLAGDGPHRGGPGDVDAARQGVEFVGRVGPERLAELRAGALCAVVPSRYAEILPLAALEAMAAGLPVVASRSGGLAELVPEEGLFAPGDAAACAEHLRALAGDAGAGDRALERVRSLTAPAVVAAALRAVYDGAQPHREGSRP